MAMRPCAAGPAAQGVACQVQCARPSVCASMEGPVVAAPTPGQARSGPFLCALNSCGAASSASGPGTEPLPAGQGAVAAWGVPAGGWRTGLAHLWGGANPKQPGPPPRSAPLRACPLSAPGDSAERARRPLGGNPDRASPRGAPGAAPRKRQRNGGWAAEPGAAETPATLAARCRRVGRRDMTCEGGDCGVAGAAAEPAEPAGIGKAEVLAPAASPPAVQSVRERGCCERGGATAQPAELARTKEAGSMSAQTTLGASPARQHACREGSTREMTTPAVVAAAAAAAAAEAEAAAAAAVAEAQAEAAELPLTALPPKKCARREGSACGDAVATVTGAAAGAAGTASRPKRLPGGNPLNDPSLRRLVAAIRSNSTEFEAGGRVMRLKQHIGAGAGPAALDAIIDALAANTRVEALYIQNFERGFGDAQLQRLTAVLLQRRIWSLNVGENFQVSLGAWQQFADALPHTAVGYLYVSEHHFVGRPGLKNAMRASIRANRLAAPVRDPEVVDKISNMWWNPRNHDPHSAQAVAARAAAARSSGGAAPGTAVAYPAAAAQRASQARALSPGSGPLPPARAAAAGVGLGSGLPKPIAADSIVAAQQPEPSPATGGGVPGVPQGRRVRLWVGRGKGERGEGWVWRDVGSRAEGAAAAMAGSLTCVQPGGRATQGAQALRSRQPDHARADQVRGQSAGVQGALQAAEPELAARTGLGFAVPRRLRSARSAKRGAPLSALCMLAGLGARQRAQRAPEPEPAAHPAQGPAPPAAPPANAAPQAASGGLWRRIVERQWACRASRGASALPKRPPGAAAQRLAARAPAQRASGQERGAAAPTAVAPAVAYERALDAAAAAAAGSARAAAANQLWAQVAAQRLARPPVMPGREPARATGGEPSRATGGEPASATGGEPARATGGEPARAAGGEPASATGGEPARAPGADPARAAGGEPARAAGGEPARAAGGESARAAGAEPARATGGGASALRTREGAARRVVALLQEAWLADAAHAPAATAGQLQQRRAAYMQAALLLMPCAALAEGARVSAGALCTSAAAMQPIAALLREAGIAGAGPAPASPAERPLQHCAAEAPSERASAPPPLRQDAGLSGEGHALATPVERLQQHRSAATPGERAGAPPPLRDTAGLGGAELAPAVAAEPLQQDRAAETHSERASAPPPPRQEAGGIRAGLAPAAPAEQLHKRREAETHGERLAAPQSPRQEAGHADAGLAPAVAPERPQEPLDEEAHTEQPGTPPRVLQECAGAGPALAEGADRVQERGAGPALASRSIASCSGYAEAPPHAGALQRSIGQGSGSGFEGSALLSVPVSEPAGAAYGSVTTPQEDPAAGSASEGLAGAGSGPGRVAQLAVPRSASPQLSEGGKRAPQHGRRPGLGSGSQGPARRSRELASLLRSTQRIVFPARQFSARDARAQRCSMPRDGAREETPQPLPGPALACPKRGGARSSHEAEEASEACHGWESERGAHGCTRAEHAAKRSRLGSGRAAKRLHGAAAAPGKPRNRAASRAGTPCRTGSAARAGKRLREESVSDDRCASDEDAGGWASADEADSWTPDAERAAEGAAAAPAVADAGAAVPAAQGSACPHAGRGSRPRRPARPWWVLH